MVTFTYITGDSISTDRTYYYVRAIVLFSLFLQTFLFLFAPLRRRMARPYIVGPIWFAFVYIDPVAYLAMAIVSSTVGNTSSESSSAIPELVGFWATFLLVHLGGADTITAFSLTDNKLWHRHLPSLLSQSATIAYVFFFTLSNKNKLWLPTLLVYVAGFIKYTERIRSLYLASWRNFQDSLLTEPDPGPDYATLMDTYISKKGAKLPSRIVMIPEPERVPKKTNEYADKRPLNYLEVVRYAYHFFQTFNGLVFCFDERAQSRTFFLNRTAREAFKVVELELNFFYEILYTKGKVLRGRYGFLLRFVSFTLTMAAFAHFYLIDKQGFHKIDVRITYILLLGAITLDITSFLKVGFSDWIVVALNQSNNPSLVVRILRKSLNVNRDRWPDENSNSTQHCTTCSFGRFKQVMDRRWSESICQCNLIGYCLTWAKKRGNFSGYKKRSMRFLEVKFTNEFRDFIFDELKMKSKLADDIETAKEIYQARGEWVLRMEGCTDLLRWINDTDFDESLLLWHIATELCCFDTQNTREDTSTNTHFRRSSKILSEYMLYLLLVQYRMMSAVARIGQRRFDDTCAEAINFFRERKIGQSTDVPLHKQACRSILDVNVTVKPAVVKGDRSKSVLFDACMLAKELEKLEEGKKWVIISKVWVELLSYAASRCTAHAHAEQLCRGGQLITFVWLLMSHLGLENQFQISEGHERATLIVGK
ncbi:hypothetical protein LOK49_LG09G01755 [Camellia lanceoleosa]|uniref:Uncharacterized protein n=1 Tax=Camellia lanceoleosa TaxID=1840588 RepID=A0ACC0GFG7_9ERIC|nr:hypothetical protein LOK49_LG09G01755 [Camellia lanceoleosa]